MIYPDVLWKAGTLFSPANAARRGGSEIEAGFEGYIRLFADQIAGSGRIRKRGSQHLMCSPTDDQAEVLVSPGIGLEQIFAIAVESESQAKRLVVGFQQLNIPIENVSIIVSPQLFQSGTLSNAIRLGRRPPEQVWGQ